MKFWSWNEPHSADPDVHLLHNSTAGTKSRHVPSQTLQRAETTIFQLLPHDMTDQRKTPVRWDMTEIEPISFETLLKLCKAKMPPAGLSCCPKDKSH